MQLRLETDGSGKLKISAEGFEGQGCVKAIQALAARMGAQPQGEPDLCPEFYISETGTVFEQELG